MSKDKQAAEALNLFHPLVRQWFREQVGTPTDVQAKAWPEIAKGNHVLVTAPTGSGKTLTAFLWAINNFLTGRKPKDAMRVLYISPLKALNNDIQRNLERPLEELKGYFDAAGETFPGIRTAVRSGDTEPSERRRMQRHPLEIFITTPESLNVLLTSKSGRRMLTGISTVILDEIHAVLPNKRGTYLITAVERLVPLCGEFQRIALSATVKPLNKVAEFVGGYQLKELGDSNEYEYKKRRVSIVRSEMQKKYHIQVNFPETSGREPNSDLWWSALTDEWRKVMDKNRSSLFFANSRRMVEKVTRFINDSEGERVYSHHGSLSKEIRSVVEKRFKEGELSAIIATSSLELGIDIGSVDEVVLIQAPFSIASTLQRIGRSGHGVGQTSRGVFYPLHSRGLLESAVIAANIDSEAIESMSPLEAPLDVLAQVLLSMTVPENKNIDELYAEIRASYPYHRLNRKEFDLVVQMLAGRYADTRIRELRARLMVDRLNNTARARDSAPMLLYQSGGVIPDRGYYNMRVADTKAKIGELDEEFVWERSLGDAFPFGNQIWRIIRITHNDVEVSQVTRSNSLVPFWRAEEMNRSYHLSHKILEFLEDADRDLGSPEFLQRLHEQHHMSTQAARELVRFLDRQKKETNAPLPHRHHLVVEHFRDPVNRSDAKQTVLHTLWGGPVNRPLAFALAAAWEEKYDYPLEIFANNDCIMLNLPHAFSASDILDLAEPKKIRQRLRVKLESTGYFGARFRENAQRALLLPRQSFHQRMPLWLNRLRSKKLLEVVSRYDDFPILLETWRGCLNYEFEIEALLNLLEELRTGEIRITEINTKKPSPFAENIIWRMTNQYMYEDDSPRSKLRTSLSDALLKEVMYSSHLRPRFSEELLHSFQEKLQRTAEGYSPASAQELLQWVKERLFIPTDEWEELLAAMERDNNLKGEELLTPINDRLYQVQLEKDGGLFAITARENLPRVSHALGIVDQDARQIAEKFSLTEIFSEEREETLVGFLNEWLRFYGPVSRDFIKTALGLADESLNTALETLLEEGRIIEDEFRAAPVEIEVKEKQEICDTENLEILLRMRRNLARPSIEPLEIEALPLFLAAYQGLVSPGDCLEDLQNSLENLFGYPARAGLWETDILPARLNPYYQSWLDTALQENELVWFGCGSERIGFCFEPDYELFAPGNGSDNTGTQKENPHAEARAALEKIFDETPGKFDMNDLALSSKLNSQELTVSLWELAWDGRITNDSFKTIRSGAMNRFKPEQSPAPSDVRRDGRRHGYGRGRRRFSLNRWQSTRPFTGNWYALPRVDIDSMEMDALDRQELVKDRIRQLFMRYGILFRELLGNELPFLRWSNIFPVLRLMELSGEIVSGHFFKGIPGLQFCTPTALGMLTRSLPEDAVYWMNATDPASPCGIGLDELRPLLPHRLPTTHLVFHGKKVVLVSKKNGKELIFNVEPGHPGIPDYLEFFKTLIGREFQPIKYISVETVNDKPVLDSPYKQALHDFGFKKDYKAMTLLKTY
ncbi:MAG: DEAD/DEAH box helicase [Candidatus Aminicenantes bacterium]|nr:DEAD/DEAH box helicase [Candidatus Aminicenantes bacterium]NIM80459.1 DEAD/DEAH box helicase [Candidatus Aminicenantes bacterium]NIN19852.1 DEAD/DEAH box helicase [Candidatus Aminicenantes bacterium]NIN43728.1 DEAD/DEAH box helicase [Candidatus Aminicenantes bacterium]NIN86478.1 DEAD/DEAH box helicase [Candidatus Aminicenantes bacterium]